MPEQLKDLARGVLAQPYNAWDGSVTLVDASEFSPTGTFTLRLDNPERTLLTVTGRNNNQFQVVHELNMASAPTGALAVQVLSVRSYVQYIEDTTFTKDDIIPISNGGTGATTAEQARINLGVPGIPVPIHQGGTGATTVEGARFNLDVFSKQEVLLLAFEPGTVTLPWPIESGGTAATTAAQARINLGIFPINDQIITQGLIMPNNQPIYWRDTAGVPFGTIYLDTLNRFAINAPTNVLFYTTMQQWRQTGEALFYLTSNDGSASRIEIQAYNNGLPYITFHRAYHNVYTVGIRSDDLFMISNGFSPADSPMLWSHGYGWFMPTNWWLHGWNPSIGNIQLIAESGGTVQLGGNSSGIFSKTPHFIESALVLNNGKALYSQTPGNTAWEIIAYVNENNVLVLGDPNYADIWFYKGATFNGAVGALGAYFAGTVTMRVPHVIRDDWGLNWMYRNPDGNVNPLVIGDNSYVVIGNVNSTVQVQGSMAVNFGDVVFYNYGNY